MVFQLTTSHGGRPSLELVTLLRTSFNSRPHTEVDHMHHTAFYHTAYLSTHDLTRRSTLGKGPWETDKELSTHDLTRRSTANIYNNLHIFNSIFLLI